MPDRRSPRFPLMRLLLLAGVGLCASVPAMAQNAQDRVTPPLGEWSLPPSGQQSQTPAPEPTPAPTQTPAQPPVVVPTVQPTPQPTATPAPQPAATPVPRSTPEPTTAQPEPAPAEPQAEAPAAETAPVPASVETPAAVPVESVTEPAAAASGGGVPRWLVALIAIALAGGAAWFLFRRRREATEQEAETTYEEPVEAHAPPPAPVVPEVPAAPVAPVMVRRADAEKAERRPSAPVVEPAAAPVAVDPSLPRGLITTRVPRLGATSPPPPPAPAATGSAPVVPMPPRPRANGVGLGFVLDPQRITLSVTQLMVEFELTAENGTDVAVEMLDVSTALVTAHEDHDAQIARFFAERPAAPDSALDVAAHTTRRLSGRLAMPIAQANRLEAQGRAYCVPIMVIDARYRWADGREERKSVAFVLGRGKAGAERLGPIFLDRGPTTVREVGARQHVPMRKAS